MQQGHLVVTKVLNLAQNPMQVMIVGDFNATAYLVFSTNGHNCHSNEVYKPMNARFFE
jgi:hypothetical protein